MPITDRVNMQIVGERLRQRRKDLQLSQQALAAELSIPQGWISELEHGKRIHIEVDTIYQFCRPLKCSMDYLVGLSDVPTPPPKRPRPHKSAPVG
jgi:transcriptional regulator with XRE-family HTH domain